MEHPRHQHTKQHGRGVAERPVPALGTPDRYLEGAAGVGGDELCQLAVLEEGVEDVEGVDPARPQGLVLREDQETLHRGPELGLAVPSWFRDQHRLESGRMDQVNGGGFTF